MAEKIYASTGTMVSRFNGYDYVTALRELEKLEADGACDGIELMMLKFYYDRKDSVINEIRSRKITVGTIHCEKDVGEILGDAGAQLAEGNSQAEKELREEALKLFRLNCGFGHELGVGRMVLHLWGGFSSDRHIEYNVGMLPELSEIASGYGLRILVENIPSQVYDPRRNWRRTLPVLGDGGFVFDTRFGNLHKQMEGILLDRALAEKIEHVHISDFAGTYRQFFRLRPVQHPWEGHVDFDRFAGLLRFIGYRNTVTIESSVVDPADGSVDPEELRHTLIYIRQLLDF